jgi:CMP-N-acetylneuraminic acid synthetase
MKKDLDIVAIVPARAGSKRLPGKNMLPLAGKPLVQWTLDAAKESGVIDLILVTSDDSAVLDLARQQGVMAIARPEDLATDTATTIDVVLHALSTLESEGYTARRVMLLQPTSPLRTADDIKNAVTRMDDTSAASVVSVCEMEHSPLWANTLPADGNMDNFLPYELLNKRSQDLPTYYRLNGAVYLTIREALACQSNFFVPHCFALVMPPLSSIDIDTAHDFAFAEFCLQQKDC